MSVISVGKLVSDYCDLDIHNLFLGENDRLVSGLLKILANNAIEIELADPYLNYRKDWKKLVSRYKRIVDKIEQNLSKGRNKFCQFDSEKLASDFFSVDEFKSLLKAEKESR